MRLCSDDLSSSSQSGYRWWNELWCWSRRESFARHATCICRQRSGILMRVEDKATSAGFYVVWECMYICMSLSVSLQLILPILLTVGSQSGDRCEVMTDTRLSWPQRYIFASTISWLPGCLLVPLFMILASTLTPSRLPNIVSGHGVSPTFSIFLIFKLSEALLNSPLKYVFMFILCVCACACAREWVSEFASKWMKHRWTSIWREDQV